MITAEELRKIKETQYNNYEHYLRTLFSTKNEEVRTKLIKAAEEQRNSVTILIRTEPIPESTAIYTLIPEVVKTFYASYGFKEVSVHKYMVQCGSMIAGIELYFNWEEKKKK